MTSVPSPTVAVVTAAEITAAQLYAVLRLRVDVFVVEQECAYPEIDGKDLLPGTTHFWIPDADGGLAGYLRVLADYGGALRIGRVCTSGSARGSGVGARLMQAAVEFVGANESVLGAQRYAEGFYARYGYRPEGEEYLEDEIPHISMRRPADA